ncbi:MAG: HAD-IIA family hydrolase [Ilumatobacteraceae bacterium]
MPATAATPVHRPRVVVLDLDGVVWLSLQPIRGSAEAVAAMRAAGIEVLFATNNSAPRVADHEQALAAIGIPAEGCVITSAQAASMLVQPGERALVVGGPGLHEALEARDATVVDERADVVVVGLDRQFTYDTLRRASTEVRNGARLLASNDDATYPTPNGPIPGGGAMLAAVATAAGVTPVIAGKPHQPMADLVLARSGGATPDQIVMVGDRPETDGLFARRIGCRYAQVRTGVVPAGVHVALADIDQADLLGVANVLLTDGGLSS